MYLLFVYTDGFWEGIVLDRSIEDVVQYIDYSLSISERDYKIFRADPIGFTLQMGRIGAILNNSSHEDNYYELHQIVKESPKLFEEKINDEYSLRV